MATSGFLDRLLPSCGLPGGHATRSKGELALLTVTGFLRSWVRSSIGPWSSGYWAMEQWLLGHGAVATGPWTSGYWATVNRITFDYKPGLHVSWKVNQILINPSEHSICSRRIPLKNYWTNHWLETNTLNFDIYFNWPFKVLYMYGLVGPRSWGSSYSWSLVLKSWRRADLWHPLLLINRLKYLASRWSTCASICWVRTAFCRQRKPRPSSTLSSTLWYC